MESNKRYLCENVKCPQTIQKYIIDQSYSQISRADLIKFKEDFPPINSQFEEYKLQNSSNLISLAQQLDLQKKPFSSKTITNIQKIPFSYANQKKISILTQQQYSQYNNNCPICAINVSQYSEFAEISVKKINRKFLFHEGCYKSLDITHINSFLNIRVIPEADVSKYPQIQNKYFVLNDYLIFFKYFVGELIISHPLSDIPYLQVIKKNLIINRSLIWNFYDPYPNNFYPNIICLPFTDFTATLNIEIDGMVMQYEFRVKIPDSKTGSKFYATATSLDMVVLEGQVISQKSKYILLDQMNFKYKDYDENWPMIKLNNIKFRFPREIQQQLYHRIHLYFSQNVNYNLQYRNHLYYTRVLYPQQNNIFMPQQQDNDGFSAVCTALEQNNIYDFVRTNNKSRLAQKFLKKCTPDQFEIFFQAIYPKITELAVCPYGNYTFQSLTSACSFEKRIRLIQKLGQDIPSIVKKKEGSHSLQNLIGSINFQSEIKLIQKYIQNNLFDISSDPHGFRIIEKLLNSFASINPKHIEYIFNDIIQNFDKYSTNCRSNQVVIELINQTKQIQYMRMKIIQEIAKKIEVIIEDPFGSYVIIKAYILYKQSNLSLITSRVMEKFVQYSCHQYSSKNNRAIKQLNLKHKAFYKRSEETMIRLSSYDQMMQTISGIYILKFLYQKSQNLIFLQDIKNSLGKEILQYKGFKNKILTNNQEEKKQSKSNIKQSTITNQNVFAKKKTFVDSTVSEYNPKINMTSTLNLKPEINPFKKK